MTKSDDEKFKKTIQRMLNTKPDPHKPASAKKIVAGGKKAKPKPATK
jgi:hypothetical protein